MNQIQVLSASEKLDLAPIGNGRTAALIDTQGTHRLVVLSALRRRSGVLPPARRRRGEGLLRRRAAWRRRVPKPTTCATPRSSRRCSRMATATPCGSPTSRRASSASSACSTRRRSIRRIEPISGLPRITIRVRPTFNYGEPSARPGRRLQPHPLHRRRRRRCGSRPMRRCPISRSETPFALTQPVTLILGPDEPLEAAVDTVVARVPGAHARLLARLGARARRAARLAERRSSARRSR